MVCEKETREERGIPWKREGHVTFTGERSEEHIKSGAGKEKLGQGTSREEPISSIISEELLSLAARGKNCRQKKGYQGKAG